MVEVSKELERLSRLVEGLMEEVREMRVVLERLLRRRMRGNKSGRVVLGVGELSRDELQVIVEFVKWMERKMGEWGNEYRMEDVEGFDRDRGLVILRKETMYEFLDMITPQYEYSRGIFGILGDIGVLKFWQSGGKRQYCIAVRVNKPVRGVVSGRYVVMYEKLKEVAEEVRRRLGDEGVGVRERWSSDAV